MAIGQPTQTTTVRVGSISAGSDDELPVFVAPHDCVVQKIYASNASNLAAASTDYTTLSFENKGSDGTGTDEIASLNNNSDGDNQDFDEFDAVDFGTLANNTLSKGDVVSFKKEDAESGSAIDEMAVTIVFEAQGGLNQFQH